MRINDLHELNKLPLRAKSYINDVVTVIQLNGVKLISLVLFGSFARGDLSKEVSDIDFLAIVDNETPKTKIREIDRIITKLEYKHGFRMKPGSLIEFIYHYVQNITGMFISHFICYEKDFLCKNFHKIFNTSKLLTSLLAPTKLVWASIMKNSKTIYGRNLLTDVYFENITKNEVKKSKIMNLLLCFGAKITYPFHAFATKFSMEALKWSILGCYFCYSKETVSIEEAMDFFKKKGIDHGRFDEMLELRKEYQKSWSFTNKVSKTIKLIHKKTLEDVEFPFKVKKN